MEKNLLQCLNLVTGCCEAEAAGQQAGASLRMHKFLRKKKKTTNPNQFLTFHSSDVVIRLQIIHLHI